MKKFQLAFIILVTLQFSCSQKSNEEHSNYPDFDSTKDYFPSKVEIDHSIGFDVVYHKNYKELHLFRHYNDVVDTVSFLLVQRGTPPPANEKGHSVIEIPVKRIVAMSTTHLGMFEVLESLDKVVGIESKQYVSSKKVRDLVDEGKILEMEPAGALNVESIIAANTQVLIGVGYPNSQNDEHQQLTNAGIRVLLNSDWQELSLLGRAEWVKMIAVLLNKEKEVNRKFGQIESEFNEIIEVVAKSNVSSPMVITGVAMGDAWHVSGGKSFAFNAMKLAKVDYPWKGDNSTGSLKLDFETVYEFGLKADFWIAPGSARDLNGIVERDTRYRDFRSYKQKTIYNIIGRDTEGGGNDYYESGIINPHVVLKDIIRIFHPELFPEHQLVYYKQLQ
jgi:cobalamin transport system substrate-binding protein